MKTLRKAVAMVLSVIMLWSVTVGVCAATNEGIYEYRGHTFEYPMTSRYLKELDEYDSSDFSLWYYEYKRWDSDERFKHFYNYWFFNYYSGDPEMWPQIYLDVYESMLEKAITMVSPIDSESYQFRVEDFSWHKRELTVKCIGDYKIKYSIKEDLEINHPNHPYWSKVYIEGDTHVNPVLVITDKEDGRLVCLCNVQECVLRPEYRYDKFKESDFEDYEYTCVANNSFTVTVPDFFNPDKHDIKVNFRYDGPYESVSAPDFLIKFYNPSYEISTEDFPYLTGDANYNGVVNLSDATAMLKCIAGWDVEIKKELADVTGDGTVDLIDVMSVLKKAAGWN